MTASRIGLVSIFSCAAAFGQVHTGDIILSVEDGAIRTGDKNGPGVRVFTSVMEDGFTDEPGFDSLNGAFDAGEVLGLDILRALHVWNGEDFWPIAEPAITVSKLQLDITSPECDRRVSNDFVFGAADANGQFHHHVSFLLEPADPGVYLLALEVWSLDADPDPSAPLYVVFDHPGHDEDPVAAAEWVAEHLFQLDCRVDMNADGQLSILDFVAMQTAFQLGDLRADMNGDCRLDVLDFVTFQGAFQEGCAGG